MELWSLLDPSPEVRHCQQVHLLDARLDAVCV